MNFSLERSFAEQQDRADPLAQLRNEFRIPRRADGSEQVYLCGHSLGLAAEDGRALSSRRNWTTGRTRAVDGHFESQRPWLSYHERFAPSLARLVGAQPLEVVAMNTLTVNLHLMLATLLSSDARAPEDPDREACVLVGSLCRRIADPAARIRPGERRCWKSDPAPGEEAVRTEDVLALIEREGAQIATVMLPGVQYPERSALRSARNRTAGARAQVVASVSTSLTRSATCRSSCTTGRRLRRLVQLQVSERGSGRDRRLLRP